MPLTPITHTERCSPCPPHPSQPNCVQTISNHYLGPKGWARVYRNRVGRLERVWVCPKEMTFHSLTINKAMSCKHKQPGNHVSDPTLQCPPLSAHIASSHCLVLSGRGLKHPPTEYSPRCRQALPCVFSRYSCQRMLSVKFSNYYLIKTVCVQCLKKNQIRTKLFRYDVNVAMQFIVVLFT